MEKAYIFGTGSGGTKAYDLLKNSYDIVAFTDNNPTVWGGTFCGKKIVPPSSLPSESFDIIFIASEYFEEIYRQLTHELNISPDRIHENMCSLHTQVRVSALENIAFEINRKSIPGSVAELGVYRGGFAKHINEVFPDRVLHLFDTFEGFDERDVSEQKDLFNDVHSCGELSYIRAGHLSNTGVELVLSKMKHPDNCRIHKGYFPETAKEIDDTEMFCFVSIDVDLYQPMLAGLRYFYQKLVTGGGVILLHDYYATGYFGGIRAFDQFYEEYPDVKYVPIGDNVSIAIVK
jgi:O-methyltransferase